MKRLFTIVSLLTVLMLVLTACGGPSVAPATDPNMPDCTEKMSDQELTRCENAVDRYFSELIKTEALTAEDIKEAERSMSNPESWGLGYFDPNLGTRIVQSGNILIAGTQATAQELQSVLGGLNSLNLFGQQATSQLFHWTHHLPVSVGGLSGSANFFQNIVSGGMRNGLVLYRSASDVYQEAYFFLSKVDGKIWAAITASDGSPITTFVANQRDTMKAIAKFVGDGMQKIDLSAVPRAIRDNWQWGAPATARFWFWSMKQIVGKVATAAGETAATTATKILEAFKGAYGSGIFMPTFVLMVCPAEGCIPFMPGQSSPQ